MINVIDSMCGSGKTSYAIQYINENSDNLFIYVTPFLDEVKRIKKSCFINFHEPKSSKGNGKKVEHARKLIELKVNVVMTHELFKRLDKEILQLIETAGYTLILDEVLSVMEEFPIHRNDIDILTRSKVINIEEDDRIRWTNEEYYGVFYDLKELSKTRNLYLHNDCKILSVVPVDYFSVFKEIFILTYLFEGQIQRCYFDLYNLAYNKYSIYKDKNGKYKLNEYDIRSEHRKQVKELLRIYEEHKNSKMNSNYLLKTDNSKTALSMNWFDKADREQLKQLNRNLTNVFRNWAPCANHELFWTVPKSYAHLLANRKAKFNKKDDRSKDNYIPFNIKATNKYGECKATAFIYNRFMNPNEKQFFEYRNIEVREDIFALSDLIQFLFRGSIRNSEEMYCYIPSPRMRSLLIDWLDYKI